MNDIYNHSRVESTYQEKLKNQKYQIKKNKKNITAMLPYPSGKLHIGHVRNYTISDALARFNRQIGNEVLHPIGWDAFGLPAENAAIKSGLTPAEWIKQNIIHMTCQLKKLGISFDWSKEISTCDEKYYKYQQYLFIKMYKAGLVYRKDGVVNWDPVDNTVLANEQVIDGIGWRSGAVIQKKNIPMYYFAITKYADELLQNDELNWPPQILEMQKQWIGKSIGADVHFKIVNNKTYNQDITVFTTRIDTICGTSYIAVAHNHPLAIALHETIPEIKAIESVSYKNTDELLGIFTGIYGIHPITNKHLPIWIASYVLMSYGTGAVIGVPSHSDIDKRFAEIYNLPKTDVINNNILINSGKYNGLNNDEAKTLILDDLCKSNIANKKTYFKLRDWTVSRQRYWGCPIPIIYCEKCGILPLPEELLPVVLPVNLLPDGKTNPLILDSGFCNTECHVCGNNAKRETDTMDTFVDSSWYFLSYINGCELQPDILKQWPVDCYIGGIEHAVLHLLYARFFYKVLRDFNLVDGNEPFKKLITQGMVLAESFYIENNGQKEWLNITELNVKRIDGTVSATTKNNEIVQYCGIEKMSKSKNNGIDPDDIITLYGADALRLFILFAGPVEQNIVWSDTGINGAKRFLEKLWRLVHQHINNKTTIADINNELNLKLQKTIKKVTYDFANRIQFNTAIASIMELLNMFSALSETNSYLCNQSLLESVLIMLFPIVPHITDNLWNKLNGSEITENCWPIAKDTELVVTTVSVQIDGKFRVKIQNQEDENELKQTAILSCSKWLIGKTINNIIFVKDKVINIVILNGTK